MSKHRSDLTETHSAFDFDVVTDAPRPFKVRRDIPADVPAPTPPASPSAQPDAASAPAPAHTAAAVK